jgi:5-formyltetrahydrofolate cyclo-ligase
MDTGPLAMDCRAQGKSLYLPVIRDDLSLQFALWVEDQDLVTNRFGIPEPGEGSPRIGAADLDIVFMPLVGWDPVGHRLGMGGGFYDRTLAGVQGPVRVGLAYDCQRSERIPPEPWDISMAFVVTETALYRCGATAAIADVSPG